MICDRKTKTWLTQYLVVFILLHNIALITKHDADYARKHGMNVGCALGSISTGDVRTGPLADIVLAETIRERGEGQGVQPR